MTFTVRGCRPGLVVLVVGFLACASAWGQLRVANWNVSNYTGGRVADIKTSVYGVYNGLSFSPDIILGEEFYTQAAVTEFVSALNTATGSPGDWTAQWVAGDAGAEGSVMFYRTSKVDYKSYSVASVGGSSPNGPRDVIRYKIKLHGYAAAGNGAVLFLYNSHMKAGSTNDDKLRRLTEAQNIRNNAEALRLLDPAFHFLFGGDMNIQVSSESAYQEMVGSQANNTGRFFDPICTPGTWIDNYTLRFVHTQDPIGPGGMDDRYDQLLVADSLVDGVGFDYIGDPAVPYSTTTWNDPNHSYRSWGNDGTSYNTVLRTTGNTMVGATIAQALINVATTAGHLPVYLDLRVPAVIGADASVDFGQVQQGSTAQEALSVWNAGDTVLWTANGVATLSYSFTASTGFSAPGGTFVSPPGNPAGSYTITMDTSTTGVKSGTLTIWAAGADETSRTVQLLGEVVAPTGCPGDCNCNDGINWRDIDYFVAAMSGEQSWLNMFLPGTPTCAYSNCDANEDGTTNWRDIDPFVALMNTPCP